MALVMLICPGASKQEHYDYKLLCYLNRRYYSVCEAYGQFWLQWMMSRFRCINGLLADALMAVPKDAN
jgi:hypothetical protein